MKTLVDERLREEALRLRLRFGCEDCAHFEPEDESCGEGFPTGPHRAIDLRKRREIEFCKAFELGG